MTAATHLSARTLTWPDYATLAVYFAASLGIGWWCARRRRSGRDFFLAGRNVAWWAAAISFFATGASSISFMALPAKTFQSDWMYFGSGPAQSLAGVVIGLVFVGVLRRLNLTTIFDYLERRFNRTVRWLGAALAVLLKVCGRMSVVMLLPALALATVTGLNVYVSIIVMGLVTTLYAMEGGFEAVVWTDVMQVAVTFGGVATALWFMAHGVTGGLAGIVHTGAAEGKFHMISWAPNVTEPTVWVFIGMFLGSMFTQLGDQPLMQRALATTDPAAARRTVVLGTLIGIPSTIIFFFVGTALAVFYQHHPDRLSAALPNDAIFPYFIVNELPHGVVGLIIAGLFAAAMGALSSAMNSTAAVVVTDFYAARRPDADAKTQARWARGSTLVAGLVATLIAAGIASLAVESLWDEYLKLLALIGGGFPGVFALGLMTRRANSPGVIIGALASIAVTWWVQTYTSVSVLLDAFVAIATCMVVGYGASLCFRYAPQPASLRGLTLWDMRREHEEGDAALAPEPAPAK
jgi:SSS family transporter